MFEKINYNYSLKEFEDGEKSAIRKAKQEAVKDFFRTDTIKELGTGSGGRTIVYQINNNAVKLICCVTKKCNTKNLNDEMTRLNDMVERDIRIGNNVFREISNWAKLRSSNNIPNINANIIPFTGTATRLSWKCDRFNRIGVDYAIVMPLAKCMTDMVGTYKYRKQAMPQKEPENLAKILTIGIDLCDALIWIHKNNLFHQDIKPENIFWFNEHYCLGDFGIAREENYPQFFQEGTWNYWAPEQANGNASVDHRCDIYSLGLVLYELADTVPIHSHYEQRIDDKKLPELESDIPEGLKKVLSNACEYEPDFRYQTAEAMKKDLCRLMENPDYVPGSTRDNYYFSRKATSKPGRSQMSSGISLPSQNIIRSGPANFQRQRQANRFLQPETAWKAGKLWYEENQKQGHRFADLVINKKIMPLSVHSSHMTAFPIRVSADPEDTTDVKPLSEILSHKETLHNMYLIGEGGIGKTTALNSIMEDTYRDNAYHPAENGKNIIPLFVELSKAPADYCSAYHASHSTFIQRYLYMLLGSVDKQYLLSENTEEMSRIMEREDTSILESVEQLLRADEGHTQYLLLLDGLNEVSKKQMSTEEGKYLGTPSELIVEEIKELLEKHKNITAIITSRADETLPALADSFKRLYLTGLSPDMIENYLTSCGISFDEIKNNSRLMKTLKVPLFLKFYSQLYDHGDVSTPGEILYSFYSECGLKYTARNRIIEISADHKKAGDSYNTNCIDKKMQWFILDFLLPELGWYMEKNDLYTIDLSTFKQVIDSVLKGEKETDICGKYGRMYFKDYLSGEDAVPNTKTYAEQMLDLEEPMHDYAAVIARYCVYSLGILYATDQNYSFIHQHIRDFFAAMKIITDMKMAVFISKNGLNQAACLQYLMNINDSLLSQSVIHYIGEITKEHLNLPEKNGKEWKDITPANGIRALIISVINLYRNYFYPNNDVVGYGMKNLLKIIYCSRHTLNGLDLSCLDLRNCYFNDIDINDVNMTGCLVNYNNLVSEINCGAIYKTAFSKSGDYVFIAGEDGTLSLWHRKTCIYVKTIKKYRTEIYNLSTSEKYIAVSTRKKTEILDIHTFEIVKKFNSYNAVFSPDGRYLVLAFYKKKARLYDTAIFKNIYKLDYMSYRYISDLSRGFDLLCFSPDNEHFAMATRKRFALNEPSVKVLTIQVWSIKRKTYFQIETEPYEALGDKIVSMDFANNHNLLAVTTRVCGIIHIFSISGDWEKAVLLHSINLDTKGFISSAKFVQDDSVIAVSFASGQLLFLDYDKYDKKNELHILEREEHIASISNTTKFQNANSSYLITGSTDHSAKLWDTKKMQCIGTFNKMSFRGIASALFIKNGKYIVTNGRNNSILFWDSKFGKCLKIIDDFPLCTSKMAYHEKKQQLAVSLIDGRVLLYEFEDNSLELNYLYTFRMYDAPMFMLSLTYSSNGEYLLGIGYENHLQYVAIYNFAKKTKIELYETSSEIKFSIGCATFYGRDGKTVLIGTNFGSLMIFSSDTGKFIKNITCDFTSPYYESKIHQLFQHNNKKWINAVHVDFNTDFLYLIENIAYLEVLNKNNGQCLAVLNQSYCNSLFDTEIFTSKQGNYITSTTRTPNIKIYRTNGWQAVYRILGSWKKENSGIINMIHYSYCKKYDGHQNIIRHVDFCPEEDKVITASADGTAKIWKLPHSEANKSMILTPICTLHCVPGLKIQGLKLEKLHSESNLSNEDKSIFKTYGAITDEK